MNKDIGKRIRLIRESKNINTKTLADAIGVLETSLSKIERIGTNNFQRLKDIAGALKINVTELLDDSFNPNIKEILPDYGFATKEELDEVKKELQVMRGILEKLSDGLLGKTAKAKKTSAGNKAYVKPRKKKD